MFRVEPVHKQAIGEDQQDEYYDAALVGKPETQGKTCARQFVKIKPIGNQHSASQSDGSPEYQQYYGIYYIHAPIPFE